MASEAAGGTENLAVKLFKSANMNMVMPGVIDGNVQMIWMMLLCKKLPSHDARRVSDTRAW